MKLQKSPQEGILDRLSSVAGIAKMVSKALGNVGDKMAEFPLDGLAEDLALGVVALVDRVAGAGADNFEINLNGVFDDFEKPKESPPISDVGQTAEAA